MCTRMLPPHWRSKAPHADRLTSAARSARGESPSRRHLTGGERDQRTRWSGWLSIVNLAVASPTVMLWRGSPLVLGLGAILVAELLLLALFYALARRGGH